MMEMHVSFDAKVDLEEEIKVSRRSSQDFSKGKDHFPSKEELKKAEIALQDKHVTFNAESPSKKKKKKSKKDPKEGRDHFPSADQLALAEKDLKSKNVGFKV